jgi:hypothetical protein
MGERFNGHSKAISNPSIMGVVVDYVRKFDSRLQVEMLRALRPATFKTPGTQVNIGTKGDVFVLTEEQRHELQAINRKRIERMNAELPASHGGTLEQGRLTNGNNDSPLPAEGGTGSA